MRRPAAVGVLAAGAVAAANAVAASHGAGPRIVIWVAGNRAAAVTRVAGSWASANRVTVKVVSRNFSDIQTNLSTVAASDAPDVILAAHDWTGQLAANGLVEPLSPSSAVKAEFPPYTLSAFSYGPAVSRLYGIPVQIENIGLVVNTKLTRIPSTFTRLEAIALEFKKKNHLAFGLCVQQGIGGDAYYMYPFFSGLGGYIFGRNAAGNLDPANIGIANPTFIKNASLIDRWNREGLINAKTGYSDCVRAFTKGQTPFWVTGPWAVPEIRKAGIGFKVVQVPAIAKPSVPLLGLDGFMVTKYASVHHVEAAAKTLVTNAFSKPAAQKSLAAAGGRAPANIRAKSSDPIVAQFGDAGMGGVPIPNIPQMSSVWSDLGAAWLRSTKGAGATPAVRSFRDAARSVAAKVG